MRKYFILLLAIGFCGCLRSQLQSRAEASAEHYIRSRFGNPRYFKPVSFSQIQKRRYTTMLDSSLDYAGVSAANRRKMESYVDSENGQRPDLAVSNEKDLYNIEHNRLSYYLLTFSFRVDSDGSKKLLKYRLELDTTCNVIDATDITYTRARPL